MKRWTMTLALVAMGSVASWAGSVCPAGNGSNPFPHSPDSTATGCNVVITINSNGSLTVTVPDSTPYEESEDVLVGVVNNSSVQVNSLNLSGSGIFGFDGDGICVYTFVGSGYCTGAYLNDPLDYAGPTSTFTNFSGGDSGTVNFAPGIVPGGTSYFSLEGVPGNTITGSVGSSGPVTAAAPAVSTWGLAFLVIGLAGLSFRMMKRTA
ncbi:MAG TPA: hypothetical protein VHW09_01190 [Bryobacteraceae bacterium]|nr:hypothetical protein [Bryobacteraceae bacterium]